MNAKHFETGIEGSGRPEACNGQLSWRSWLTAGALCGQVSFEFVQRSKQQLVPRLGGFKRRTLARQRLGTCVENRPCKTMTRFEAR
jgi:hypothetical protein